MYFSMLKLQDGPRVASTDEPTAYSSANVLADLRPFYFAVPALVCVRLREGIVGGSEYARFAILFGGFSPDARFNNLLPKYYVLKPGWGRGCCRLLMHGRAVDRQVVAE